MNDLAGHVYVQFPGSDEKIKSLETWGGRQSYEMDALMAGRWALTLASGRVPGHTYIKWIEGVGFRVWSRKKIHPRSVFLVQSAA